MTMNNLSDKKNDKLIEKQCGLVEFHASCIDILKAIDEVCKKSDISYSTAGGTMLGHIRHQGFIPWDDDADIALERINFNKFIDAWNKNKEKYPHFKLCTPNSYGGSFLDMQTHIIDTRIRFEPYGGFKNYKELEHPRVDIFPLDYIPKNKFKFAIHSYHLKIIYGLASSRIKYKPEVKRPIIETLALNFFKLIGHALPFNLLLNRFRKVSQSYLNKNHDNHILHSSTDMLTIDVRYLPGFWSEYERLPFENIYLMCSKQYHKILSNHYGDDYMTPRFDASKYRKHFEFNINSNSFTSNIN